MALTDGLICRISPAEGDTEIRNTVDGSVFAGTGTPELIDVGGEKAWRLTTGTFLTNAIPAILLNAGADGTGTTTALRFKRVSAGTDTYIRFAGLTTSAGATSGGPHFTPFDGNKYRGRVAAGGVNATAPDSVANGDIVTLVYRVSTLAASASAPNMDSGSTWQSRVGRVGTAPDAIGYGNLSNLTLTLAFLNCQTSAEFVLLDRADWNRPLTEAEAASVADNYRGVMPAPSGGGGVAPAGTTTIGTITPSANGASADFAYSASDHTGFDYRIDGGEIKAGTSSPQQVTGLTASTTYTIEVRAKNATGPGVWSDPKPFTTTAAAGLAPQGTFAIGAITMTQTTASVPYTYSASDQTEIQYRLDGGNAGTATASPQQLTGLIAGSAYTIAFRAVNSNGDGDWSAAVPFTTNAVVVGTIASEPLVRPDEVTLAVNSPLVYVDAKNISTGALVVRKTGLSTDAAAIFTFSDPAVVTGTRYEISWLEASGDYGIAHAEAT